LESKVKLQLNSKQLLIRAAKELFWEFGIKKISVEEICQKAEISKMTFYRNFRNKGDIAIELMEQMANQSMEEFRNIMNLHIPFTEKVMHMIDQKSANTKGISKAFISDIYLGNSEGLRNALDKMQGDRMEEIMKYFAIAQETGEIRKDLNLQFLMYMMNDIKAKLTDKNLGAMYPKEEDLIMELTNFFFKGILP